MAAKIGFYAIALTFLAFATWSMHYLLTSHYAFLDEHGNGVDINGFLGELLLAAGLAACAGLAFRSGWRVGKVPPFDQKLNQLTYRWTFAGLGLLTAGGIWLVAWWFDFMILMGWMFVDYGDPDHPGHLKGLVISKPWFAFETVCVAALLVGAWHCFRAARRIRRSEILPPPLSTT